MLKTKYDNDIGEVNKKIKQGSGVASIYDLDAVKNKIPNVSGFLLISAFNFKITEVENKIPTITGLATNSVLAAVENKIPDVSALVKKQILILKLLK